MTQNKQFANVGNLGDILKHAALVSLIELLHSRGKRLLSVDTHAFLLEAPCPDPSRWLLDAERERCSHAAFEGYIKHQNGVGADPSLYRCSSGLVVDVSRAAGRVPTLILAELDSLTRARLKDQLNDERVEPRVLLDDARKLSAIAIPDTDVMFALVDPFKLDQALWQSIAKSLSRFRRSVKAAVVEVFIFDNSKARVEWPGAPAGFTGPVATIDRRPYHLAIYATSGIAEECGRACVALGWELVAHENTAEELTAGNDPRYLRAIKDWNDHRLVEVITSAVARSDDDARASLVHQRLFVERIVHIAAQLSGLDLTFVADAAAAIRALESHLKLSHNVVGPMHWVRQRGNDAAHRLEIALDSGMALEGLRHCHDLAHWFAARFEVGGLERFAFKAASVQNVSRLLETRANGRPPATVQDTVPDPEQLRWVYFATPTKASRGDTYELAYSRGVVCSDTRNASGNLKPNVRHIQPGDLMLLAYGEDGEYEPQLYVTIESPITHAIDGTKVLHELPNELAPLLATAGYKPDPFMGVFTGFRVTPCSDWKGQIQPKIRKPVGQNFLRTWEEVRIKNGWE